MNQDLDSQDALLTVSRGLHVLRAFRGERYPLSNGEIVARTGLPKSTVSRLTTTLMSTGFLRHAAGGRQFELSTSSLGIGHAFLETSPMVSLAQPLMQALADRLNVSVALAIRDKFEMLYVTYCSGRHIATLRLGVGSLLPMETTAIGRAYMWGLAEPARESLIDELRQRSGAKFDATYQGILGSFEELARTGTCLVKSGYQRDTYGIGLPVRLGRQRIVASLNCGAAVVGADFTKVGSVNGAGLKELGPQLEHILQDLDLPI
jgi:DNA-binding IclR family transcriptional regulator